MTISSEDTNIYKSAKNIPRVTVTPVGDLNAGEICSYRKMLFTKEALMSILAAEKESEN